MGCGQTLAILYDPHASDPPAAYCGSSGCPDSRAMEKIMRDPETEHTVQFAGDRGFTVKHPVRERVGNRLMICRLHAWLMEHRPTAADTPGVYRVTPDQDSWSFTLIHPEEVVR